MRDQEHIEQSLLFQWAELQARQVRPELHLMFAVPNFAGHHGSKGARIRSGKRAKDEGRKKGVPDVILPVARGRFHGLFIEMKTEDGSVKPEQKTWHAELRRQGYVVCVCRSSEAAQEVIVTYLDHPDRFGDDSKIIRLVPKVWRHANDCALQYGGACSCRPHWQEAA